MKLSDDERFILGYLSSRERVEVIPEDVKDRFTPETLEFTLAQLQAKGLIEYVRGRGFTMTKKAEELFKKREAVREVILARGHPQITATHSTTMEITKESDVSERGNCIIGVKANKSCADLKLLFKGHLKFGKEMRITISVDGTKETVTAYGSPALLLDDEKGMVIRKSDFIDGRTLAILSNKAAKDLSKSLVEKLKDPNAKVRITLEIK